MDYYQSLKRGSEIDSTVTYVNEKLPQKVNDIENEIAELKSSKLDKTSYNTNVYTKEEVNAKLSSVYFYKGTKTVDEINAISVDELTAGWTYNVSDSGKLTVGSQAVTVHQGDNVSWTGEFWDKLASDIDFSAYYTKTEVEDYVDATIDEKSLTADDDDSGNVTLQIAAATDIDGKDSEIDTYFFENYPKIYRIQDSLSDTSVGYYILFVTSEYSSLDMTNLTRQYKFQNGSIYTRLGNSLSVDDAWSDWEKVDGGTTGGVTDVKVNGTSVTANGVANISIDIVSGKESKVDTYFYEGAQTIYKIDGNEGMVYGGDEYFLFVTGYNDPFAMFYQSYQYKFDSCAIYVRSETEVNSRIWNDWKKIDGNMTDVKVNGTSVVTDGVANIPIAAKTNPGVVKIGDSSSVGLTIDSTGAIYIAAASPSQINARANSYNPIVPSNLSYAVRSIHPDFRNSVPSAQSAYEIDTIYSLAQQTNLAITLPSGKVGSFIQVDFISGTTPTTLSVTSSAGIVGFDLVPEANVIYSLYFDWGIVSSAASYGWRCTYSEYDISTTGG